MSGQQRAAVQPREIEAGVDEAGRSVRRRLLVAVPVHHPLGDGELAAAERLGGADEAAELIAAAHVDRGATRAAAGVGVAVQPEGELVLAEDLGRRGEIAGDIREAGAAPRPLLLAGRIDRVGEPEALEVARRGASQRPRVAVALGRLDLREGALAGLRRCGGLRRRRAPADGATDLADRGAHVLDRDEEVREIVTLGVGERPGDPSTAVRGDPIDHGEVVERVADGGDAPSGRRRAGTELGEHALAQDPLDRPRGRPRVPGRGAHQDRERARGALVPQPLEQVLAELGVAVARQALVDGRDRERLLEPRVAEPPSAALAPVTGIDRGVDVGVGARERRGARVGPRPTRGEEGQGDRPRRGEHAPRWTTGAVAGSPTTVGGVDRAACAADPVDLEPFVGARSTPLPP